MVSMSKAEEPGQVLEVGPGRTRHLSTFIDVTALPLTYLSIGVFSLDHFFGFYCLS